MKYVKASQIIYCMEEAARAQMEAEKPSVDDLIEKNIALMVNRLDLVVSRPIDELEEYSCTAWPCPSDRATLLRCYSLKVGEEEVAYCSANWSVVNFKARRIMKVKELDMRKYTMGKYRNPFGNRKFRITAEDEALMKEIGTIKVGRNDLDDNGHMNNVMYIKHIEDLLDKLSSGKYYVAEARLHFIKEVFIDRELKLKHLERDGREYILMADSENSNVFECELLLKEI